jgi:type VI secretion system secreted protein VgrG
MLLTQTTQDTRLLELRTPLGENALLIRSISGQEAMSQLYSFDVEAFAPNEEPADFSKLIGQAVSISVGLKNNELRYFHGIVKSFSRGARSFVNTAYRLEIVPVFWLLSQRTQSRIFQQVSIPEILKKVLEGLDVDFELAGDFQPRDYCVQYRESDFAFASRLMEEEGIFYYFRHREDGHTLVVANSPRSHEDLPCDNILCFDEERGGVECEDEIVYSWEKQQTLKPGKVTLWDHSFELPHKSLDAQELVDEFLQIGDVTHQLKLAGNDKLEIYDYPGGYAQRFDGIAPGGAERTADLQKIYEDNQRTARIRVRQENAGAILITAHTDSLHLCPGYKFELDRHYSDNDTYVITSTSIAIPQRGAFAGENDREFSPPPEIVFNCIPVSLPFLPSRITPKPTIYGTQTAVVTGPAGEEIFTDKYGRVKVQFFWDRDGKFDGSSSCWVRVASPWAGKQFGMVHIPRIGQEVVVAFEEGDPDQPIIVGSVYNADQMPPHELPANKTMSGVKTRSTPGAAGGNLNEIRFEDRKGSEHLFIHGEKDIHTRSKASYFESVGGDFHQIVKGESRTKIDGKTSVKIGGDHAIGVTGDMSTTVGPNYTLTSESAIALASAQTSLHGGYLLYLSGQTINVTSQSLITVGAPEGITLACGDNFIRLHPDGIEIVGLEVKINSGGSTDRPTEPFDLDPISPDPPVAALTPGETKATVNPAGSRQNTHDENDIQNKDKTHWIEFQLKDESGAPVIGMPGEVTLPNGKIATRNTNKDGLIRVNKIDPGQCTVRWIELDQDALSQ